MDLTPHEVGVGLRDRERKTETLGQGARRIEPELPREHRLGRDQLKRQTVGALLALFHLPREDRPALRPSHEVNLDVEGYARQDCRQLFLPGWLSLAVEDGPDGLA